MHVYQHTGMRKEAPMTTYQPLAEKAYDYISELITSGQLNADEFYSETRFAKEIGVSRTPMRDALMRLSQDRYIDIVPSKGFRLHGMSEEDIVNTFQVRTAIEGFCALSLYRRRGTPEGKEILSKLEESIKNMKQAIDDDMPHSVILKYDLGFHREIVNFSKNRDMIEMIASYSHMLSDIAARSFEKEGRPLEAWQEHKSIYDKITSDKAKDESEIYFAVMHHMESSRDICIRMLG